LNAAEVEASSRRLEHLQTQVKELQHELNQAHHRQAHTELKLAEENDVLKQRLAALGTAGSLLMQVALPLAISCFNTISRTFACHDLCGQTVQFRPSVRMHLLQSHCARGLKCQKQIDCLKAFLIHGVERWGETGIAS